jgi:hypothetical protein
MTLPTLHSFAEIQIAVDRVLLFGVLGRASELQFVVDEFLKDDPHTIMLLTWMEMQG